MRMAFHNMPRDYNGGIEHWPGNAPEFVDLV